MITKLTEQEIRAGLEAEAKATEGSVWGPLSRSHLRALAEEVLELREALRPFVNSPAARTNPPLPDDTPFVILGSECLALNGPEYEKAGGTWPHPLYRRRDLTAGDLRRARAALGVEEKA